MVLKSKLMTTEEVSRALMRIAHQIAERNDGVNNVVLLGIKRGGVPIAKQLAVNLNSIEGHDVPVGHLDITHYRDDLHELSKTPIVSTPTIDFDIEGKTVIIVDDVLYTGRTVRAALDAVSKHGRAKTIQLAVLIDRGHRELPVRADFVGKNVPTSRNETVVIEPDEDNRLYCVNLYEK